MSDTVYEFTLGIGFVGAEHKEEFTLDDMGYTQEEWDKLEDKDKEEELRTNWNDWSNNYIDGGWDIVK
jgi:hypothetical protein